MQIGRILSGCIFSATRLSPWQNRHQNVFDDVLLLLDDFYDMYVKFGKKLERKKEKKQCVCDRPDDTQKTKKKDMFS